MKKIRYILKEGDLFANGSLVFIKELPSKIRNDGRMRRIGLFKCSCGKEFESGIMGIKHGHAKSCGCLQKKIVSQVMFKHGLSSSSQYDMWTNMKLRIFDNTNKEYKNYGGRGITIFPPWIHDFQLFYDYVSALPNFKKRGYSIDRIDNDGNYEPGNLRWATRHIQNTNNRKRKSNTSGYVGVSKFRDKWQAAIGGKHIGHYETKEQAAISRNNYIIANHLIEYKIQEVRQ
jgi:hypothetical protein